MKSICIEHYVVNSLVATTPVITNVAVFPTSLVYGGTFTVIVNISSNAALYFLSRSFSKPCTNIYGGGSSGWDFKNLTGQSWSISWSDTIERWYPSGNYTYSGIQVSNQGIIDSNIWPDIVVKVNNDDASNVTVEYCPDENDDEEDEDESKTSTNTLILAFLVSVFILQLV